MDNQDSKKDMVPGWVWEKIERLIEGMKSFFFGLCLLAATIGSAFFIIDGYYKDDYLLMFFAGSVAVVIIKHFLLEQSD